MRASGYSTTRRLSMTAIVAIVATLGGCAAVPHYVSPATEVSGSFYNDPGPDFDDASPEDSWWQGFDDPIVSELVSDALVENHDIRIARVNIAEARAELRQSEFDAYPTVTTRASVRKNYNSFAATPGADRTVALYDAGFDARWELDFFGSVSSAEAATAAEYEAAIFDRRAVAVVVAAEVARHYIELRGAQKELDVVRQNAANQRRTYDLVLLLESAGRATRLDVARSEAQLQNTHADMPPLEEKVARAIHRLAVLTGRQPALLTELLAEVAPIPSVPDTLSIGTPTDLLRRRADVQRAERRLAAATARVGVATSNLFPRITILGSAGTTARTLDGLSSGRNSRSTFGPFLSWAALDLGTVRAQIVAAEAKSGVMLFEYEQTVLQVLEEAENALVKFAKATSRHAHLQAAAETSETAERLARIRYQAGADSFLDVLVAERQLLDVQRKSAKARTEWALAFVSLYKALGGGWQRLEELDPVS